MELTVEQIKKEQLSDYASGRCTPYTLLNDRIDFLLSELDKRTPSPSACKASPSGCKSESAEKLIEVVNELEDYHWTENKDAIRRVLYQAKNIRRRVSDD